MNSFFKFAATTAVAALLAPGIIAAADDAPVGTAAFASLAVTGGAGTIDVVGSATFGGETLVVGTDDSGDGAVPGLGSDLLGLTISQDPASGLIEFRLDTDLAASASAPGLAWGIPVGGSSLASPQLLAFASDENGAPGAFQFGIGTGGGVNEDFSIASVDGRVDGSELVWSVLPAQIGVEAGRKITASDAAFSTTGAKNAAFSVLSANPLDDASMTESFSVGGGAQVKVLDTAGEIVDEGTARVRRGEFSLTIDELAAGTYTVEVTTPYADGGATETFSIKVS
ncbi:MAG: hypothetical protein ACI867_000529 [Glaciecola sp.]|jgi:hypothetical protein